jgi:outer membrane autotransporter protein
MTLISNRAVRARTAALLATASALTIIALAGSAQAGPTVINGVTDTVPGTFATPFNIDGGLQVGTSAMGELDVNTAAAVTVTNCFYVELGVSAAGTGTLKLDGAGTTFNNGACGALIGEAGSGTLSITNGAVFTTSSTNNAGNILGEIVNSNGTATINGAGSIWNFSNIVVGDNGTGTLTVSGGGLLNQVSCSAVDLGNGAKGVGTINVTGAGSKWVNTCNGPGNLLTVGDDGIGVINVTAGGVFHGGQSVFAGFSDGAGGLLVSGAGSQFLSNNQMTMGQGGSAHLSILAGGLVTDSGASIGGVNSTATVDGVGSIWTNSGTLSLNAASATLAISNGGAVTSTNGSDGGSVSVAGAGSHWTISGALGSNMYVGGASVGSGVLSLSAGGVISDLTGSAAAGSHSLATVTIDGANTAWTNATTTDFGGGFQSTFNLAITNGGALIDTSSDLETGTTSIHGAGAVWTNSANVIAGDGGQAQIYLYNGGALSVGGGTGSLTLGGIGFGAGTLTIGAPAAPLQTPGTLLAATLNLRTATSAVVFDHSAINYVFAPSIIGIGTLTTQSGATVLTGTSTYTGATAVQGGSLLVNGALGATSVSVASGGALGGFGSIGGPVGVSAGGHLVGIEGQILTTGAVTLATGANVDVTLAGPSASQLFQVNGALVLNGALNVIDAGGFSPGLYRLFDYTGALSGGGIAIGATPVGVLSTDLTVLTATAGQVNLLYGAPATTQFWNGSTLTPAGAVVGGAGTWNVGSTNWSDAAGVTSGAWPSGFAIFSAAPGAVTIDNSGGAVNATGLQFAVTGYSVGGGPLTLTGAAPDIRVGDGTAAGANYTATISAPIAGSVGLIKTDLGTLVLSGANTFTGGVTISAGALSVAADANLGAAANGVTFNGGNLTVTQGLSTSRNFTFASAATLTVVGNGNTLNDAGAFSGAGALTEKGSGTFAYSGSGAGFSGALTLAGGGGDFLMNGTIGAGGVVTVAAGGYIGGSGVMARAVQVQDFGTLSGFHGETLTMNSLSLSPNSNILATFAGPSTTAMFQVNGALTLDGVLIVNGTAGFAPGLFRLINYTGALTDNGLIVGTVPVGLPLSDFSVQTSVAGQVNLIYANSPLQFWNGSTVAPTGAVVGGVGTWQVGPTNWTDANGVTSAAWNGVDAVFAAGPAAVTINNGPGVVNANFLQFAAGGFSVGGGVLTLTGPAPTIRVGDGTAAGAAYIATISSVIAGSGGLTKTDLGALILSGNNTFTGGLILNGGLLGVSADANLGDPTNGLLFTGGVLAATASFTSHRLFDVSGPGGIATASGVTLTLTNSLSGAGALAKTGTGVLDLTGASSYNGAIAVNAGTLQLDGSIAGTIAVNSGASLKGVGVSGAVTVNAGGVLAPSNSAGALSVNGALTFQPGSSYVVAITPQGQSDRVNASGAVALNGGVVTVVNAPGAYALGTHYTIVTASGESGPGFSGLAQNLNQPFLQLTMVYDVHDVFLNVTRNSASFCSVAITKNQCAAAGGAESLGIAAPLYDAIANSPSVASAQGAFDALSGEVHASIRGVEVEDSRLVRDAALGRLDQGHPDGRATWGQIFAVQGGVDSDGNAASVTRTVGGFLMGADTPADADWRIGGLAGYSQTRLGVSARASSGDSDDYHLGAYVGWQGGPLKARFGAAYTWRDISTSRGVAFPGFAEVEKGSTRSGAAQVFGELAYPIGTPDHAVEPFAGGAVVSLHTNGFTEAGGAAALRADAADTSTSFATAGLRASETWTLAGGASVSLRGSVAWRGAYGEFSQGAHLALSPGGSTFDVYGAPIAKDAVVANVAISAKLSPAARVSLGYVGQSSATTHDDGVTAGLKVSF